MTPFSVVVLATVALLLILRVALRQKLAHQVAPALLPQKDYGLRPAEIAYLTSNGDIDHALLVLGADLVQRALKAKLSDQVPPLAVYETVMWDLAKEAVAGWAAGKVEPHLPRDIGKDPVEYVRRVSKIYKFVVHTARSWVTELLADPRQIRRYFRMSAIANLIADFTTAGYKVAFEEEFRRNLQERGLLVPANMRLSYARIHLIFAVLGVLTLVGAGALLLVPWYFGLTLTLMSLGSAAVLKLALFLIHSVPLYSDLAEVLGHLERKSWRLNLVRLLVGFFTAISYLLVILAFLLLSGVAFAVLALGFHSGTWTVLAAYAFSTVAFLVPTQLFFDAWLLTVSERASALAERDIVKLRRQLASTSPLLSFKEVLTTTQYVPTFSELLALYGVETLLILA